MCFPASHPVPAPRWQESRGIAGGEGKIPWPVGTAHPFPWHVPSAPSAWPASVPGNRVTSVPCTEPGPPSRSALPGDAPGLVMPNSRHQLLLSLLGYSGLPAPDPHTPAMPGCMGRLRSPPEPRCGRCPVLLPRPSPSPGPVPGAAAAALSPLHVLPPPPRRFRGRGLTGRGRVQGYAGMSMRGVAMQHVGVAM